MKIFVLVKSASNFINIFLMKETLKYKCDEVLVTIVDFLPQETLKYKCDEVLVTIVDFLTQETLKYKCDE